MNYVKFVFLIFCLSIFLSCASFKDNIRSEDLVELKESNLNLLNGIYQNNDEKRPSPLEYSWGSFYKMREYSSVYELVYEQKKPYFISLKVINKKKIEIKVIVDGRILKSYIIKGQLKDGYFEQNRKMFIIPLLILNVYHSSKFRIGLHENGNTVTDFKKYDFGTYYFINPHNNNETYMNIEHKRIHNFNKQ